ncbi:MAG: glycosyltransferase family 1 protein [Kineosporiaceae bacterium]
MRVAIITESFLPQVNGVTNSVLRLCEQLTRRGHDALVVAPGSGPTSWAGVPVVRVSSVPVPGYREHRLGLPSPALSGVLESFAPDVVHLASPTVLGAQGAWTAQRLDVPCLAVYQTDLAGFMTQYRAQLASRAVWRWIRRLHALADLTLAPSTAAISDLERHGIPRVRLWPRGVDLDLFHPSRRDPFMRRRIAPGGELIVGYVGRLAAEKRVDLLGHLADLAGVRLAIIGDGPQRSELERRLPHARFLGLLGGEELAGTVASLDVFVHSGPHETFCQSAQEALASGVPVVAPSSGGLLDLVRPQENGLLYPPGDGPALRAAVAAVISTPGLRDRLAANARASVAERSWTRIGDAYLDYCAEVLRADSTRLIS